MSSNLDQFIGVFDGFKVLRLPYVKKGEDKRQFSMYIFLPNANDGLLALIEKLASEFELLEHSLRLIKMEEVDKFEIPKFKFSFGLETSHMLKELGVTLPFSSRSLTKMVDSLEGQNLFVSNVFHKSFVDVNEEGTEAATTNIGVIEALCVPSGIDFVADHPFLFLIREDLTKTILFAGQVLNPLDC
jgi:serpin B